MAERDYWLGFSVFSGIGPIKFKKLLEQFNSAKDAWNASVLDLSEVIGEKLAEKFDKYRDAFSVSNYARRFLNEGVSFLILTDKDYPKLLSQIKNPPFVLYTRGNFDFNLLEHQNTIAVVGSRKTTQYGREVTKILVEELASAGFTIVSGLAIGVDAISHKTAIDNNVKTIAVLGCGVDCCYPLANKNIYNSIVQGSGAVISEVPLGFAPSRGSFPARNRIIAGLSLGVLVTEGAEDSGSLITAGYAVKFGHPVFAVPGPITSSLSKGPYKLLERGAKIVTKVEDIINELGIMGIKSVTSATGRRGTANIKGENKGENMILEILQNEPLHFDEILRRTGLQSSRIGSILSVMEVKGMVRSLEGGGFEICR